MSSLPGISSGNGTGDSSGVDGPWRHLPPHLLFAAAGWKCAWQLRWAQVHWGPAGRLAAQSRRRWGPVPFVHASLLLRRVEVDRLVSWPINGDSLWHFDSQFLRSQGQSKKYQNPNVCKYLQISVLRNCRMLPRSALLLFNYFIHSMFSTCRHE